MAMAPQQLGIGIRRHFTKSGVDPYDTLEWERRDARIPNFKDGGDAFFQPEVEFPTTWSLNATNIVAQKYFRGTLGTAEREWSLRQVIDRVADTITDWGTRDGYFVDEREADAFRDELKYVLVHQRASFNSPVWFNIGVKGVPQQASACQPYDALGRHARGPRADRQARRRRRGRHEGARRARPHADRRGEGQRHQAGAAGAHQGRRHARCHRRSRRVAHTQRRRLGLGAGGRASARRPARMAPQRIMGDRRDLDARDRRRRARGPQPREHRRRVRAARDVHRAAADPRRLPARRVRRRRLRRQHGHSSRVGLDVELRNARR